MCDGFELRENNAIEYNEGLFFVLYHDLIKKSRL